MTEPFKVGDEVAYLIRYNYLPQRRTVEKVHKSGRVVISGSSSLFRPTGTACGSHTHGAIHHWTKDDDRAVEAENLKHRAIKALEVMDRRRRSPFSRAAVAALEAAADIIAPGWRQPP